ncbi:hypothetical protein L1049_018128 [Liquidambar formosana]|uniref:RNase H type-1 domain-containing protein n=1 Tax=Liquidambar formosana TaxID=63359 RepID=A0AAP0NKA7_LIQFO
MKEMSLDPKIPDIFTGDAEEKFGCLMGFASRWFLEMKETSLDPKIPDIFTGDAEEKIDLHCVGFGIMIRDWEGQAIAAASKLLVGAFPVTLVEAMAVRFALRLAHDLGLHSVELEGDILGVVNSIIAAEEMLTPLGLIVEDILFDATQFFTVVSFSHIPRDGNMVAHDFARHAMLIEDLCVWVEDVPDCIRDHFFVDVNL